LDEDLGGDMKSDIAQDRTIRLPAQGTPTVASTDLFGGGREVVIRHGAETYRLRLTSSNKLILIK
jgi:hemin uptake protein HemP